ncbi:MAG: DUF1295 domain-containing protein [Spirochaetes bacterium]|jgi:steroid 5-alpha reductase family enzyme|nr:DUF1295 domain-containing protein [Spirochaetota bacterium]
MKFILFLMISAASAGVTITSWSMGSPASFLANADPLEIIALVAASLAATSFIAGLVTGDYSYVDRLWSIVPVIYTWIFALRKFPDARLLVMAVLVTLWGARLTFNFARKGGYSGMEDYRWAEVRKVIKNRFLWQAFNLIFISAYQNLLFVLFVMPAWMAFRYTEKIGTLDIIAAMLFLALLGFETLADQQQWNFHQSKKTGGTGEGFLSSGLFRYSRHPNYFAEISIWWTVYLFGVSASGMWLHWSIAGAVLLTLLFHGSTVLTEKISSRKYPSYKNYAGRTSRIIPWFPGR